MLLAHIYENVKQINCLHSMLLLKSLKNVVTSYKTKKNQTLNAKL